MAKTKAKQTVTESAEVAAAYLRIEDYFDAWGYRDGIKLLNKMLKSAMSPKVSKENAASVLFLFKTLKSLIGAMLLIHKTGYQRDAAILVPPEDGFPDLSMSSDYCRWQTTPLWKAFPRMLSTKEYFNPYIVFKKAAHYADNETWDYILDELLDYSFYNTSFADYVDEYNIVTLQRLLQKMIEASYLVFVRTRKAEGTEKPEPSE